MPELVEQMYCSQQIVIPPKFPYILKRYCKAAIKTQPYDLLRWSFEYFRALADRRPPPVKLRLEYPVYSTEGGLTRGCLKVLANQLAGQQVLPLTVVKAAWQGFCLDPEELNRIFCLCEVYMRNENVPFLHFIAVAGGMLTKSLTHTMILLCETLTKEPDGGSAAICVRDFLTMYRFLASMDASTDTRYIDGYREGYEPPVEEESIEEEEVKHIIIDTGSEDDYWHTSTTDLQKLTVIDDHFANTAKLSSKMTLPVIQKIERSPSAERAAEIERENYMRDWTEKPRQDEEINKTLRQLSAGKMPEESMKEEAQKEEVVQEEEKLEIYVFDEDDNPVPLEFYGESELREGEEEEEEEEGENLGGESKKSVTTAKSTTTAKSVTTTKSATAAKSTKSVQEAKSAKSMKSTTSGAMEEASEEAMPEVVLTKKQKLQAYVQECYQEQADRREDLEITFEEIAALVDRYQTANYDLGMVAGRQMSITSGEFIVHHIEKEILEYIDEQIGILPDPDLKKKKAKPEEVDMIREMLETWLDENMDIIAPEIEEVEEEEEPIPEITTVYAVPGIGPPVDDDTMHVFVEYALDVCKVQAEVFMPRNIRHFMCPPLEKYVEHLFEDDRRKPGKEQVPTGGIITD